MNQKLEKPIKFLVVIILTILFLCLFCFVGCSKEEDSSEQLPTTESDSIQGSDSQENSNNLNPDSNDQNTNNNSSLPENDEGENEPSETPSSSGSSNQNPQEDSDDDTSNNGNQENPSLPSPEESSDQNSSLNPTSPNEDSSNNEEETDSEKENIPGEATPPTQTDEYSLNLKTFESIYGYEFENEVFKIDFATSNILYFQFKLLKNQELVENVHFNICLSDPSFGIFDSVNYNSLFIEIQKIGEFEITISSAEHDFSKTFKVVVL